MNPFNPPSDPGSFHYLLIFKEECLKRCRVREGNPSIMLLVHPQQAGSKGKAFLIQWPMFDTLTEELLFSDSYTTYCSPTYYLHTTGVTSLSVPGPVSPMLAPKANLKSPWAIERRQENLTPDCLFLLGPDSVPEWEAAMWAYSTSHSLPRLHSHRKPYKSLQCCSSAPSFLGST